MAARDKQRVRVRRSRYFCNGWEERSWVKRANSNQKKTQTVDCGTEMVCIMARKTSRRCAVDSSIVKERRIEGTQST
jgi:hypothetical protein